MLFGRFFPFPSGVSDLKPARGHCRGDHDEKPRRKAAKCEDIMGPLELYRKLKNLEDLRGHTWSLGMHMTEFENAARQAFIDSICPFAKGEEILLQPRNWKTRAKVTGIQFKGCYGEDSPVYTLDTLRIKKDRSSGMLENVHGSAELEQKNNKAPSVTAKQFAAIFKSGAEKYSTLDGHHLERELRRHVNQEETLLQLMSYLRTSFAEHVKRQGSMLAVDICPFRLGERIVVSEWNGNADCTVEVVGISPSPCERAEVAYKFYQLSVRENPAGGPPGCLHTISCAKRLSAIEAKNNAMPTPNKYEPTPAVTVLEHACGDTI